jgi:hypothetical protein
MPLSEAKKIANKKWRDENKENINILQKQYREKNREILRMYDDKRRSHPVFKEKRKKYDKGYRLFKDYGLRLEQYSQMLTSQNNCCAIDEKPFLRISDQCVDHNHVTGEIRQIICRKHNIALGMCNDSAYEISKLLSYIEKWEK